MVPSGKGTAVYNRYEVLREEMEDENKRNGQETLWIDLSGDESEEKDASHKTEHSRIQIIPPEVKAPIEARPRPSCSVWTCRRRADELCAGSCEEGFCRVHLGRCSECGLAPLCSNCIHQAGHECRDTDSDMEDSHIPVISDGAVNLDPGILHQPDGCGWISRGRG